VSAIKRHKKHEDHEEHASEAWLVAFADMMTLLMVTFLMMFAISALDLQKFKTFQEAFEQGLGKNTHQLAAEGAPAEGTPHDVPIGTTEGVPVATPSPAPLTTGPKKLQPEELDKLKQQIEAAVAKAGLSSAVQVERDPRGLILYVTSGILFDGGKAQLTPVGSGLLGGLGPALTGIGNDLVIEGHTDSRPISSAAFPSNWELSTARATAVLRFLIDKDHVAAGRMSASGFADTRPRVTGSSEASYAKNRRVDIVVYAPAAAAAAAPPAPAATPGVVAAGKAPAVKEASPAPAAH
jgi:chemotaxis protein MotB